MRPIYQTYWTDLIPSPSPIAISFIRSCISAIVLRLLHLLRWARSGFLKNFLNSRGKLSRGTDNLHLRPRLYSWSTFKMFLFPLRTRCYNDSFPIMNMTCRPPQITRPFAAAEFTWKYSPLRDCPFPSNSPICTKIPFRWNESFHFN